MTLRNLLSGTVDDSSVVRDQTVVDAQNHINSFWQPGQIGARDGTWTPVGILLCLRCSCHLAAGSSLKDALADAARIFLGHTWQ